MCYCWKELGHLCDGAGLSAILFVCSFADPTQFPPFFANVLKFTAVKLGFEFCVFVAGWRHALRSEWPFIIIIKLCIEWPLENKVPMRSPYAFYPGVALR